MRLFLAGLAAATVAVAVPAAATTTVDFANIKATWYDAVGGTHHNFPGNGTATAGIRWGNADQQSGYGFEAIGIPQLVVNPATDTSAVTNIGKFTHYNFPIPAGGAITGVKLLFSTDVTVNGVFFDNVEFIYAFDHLETPNADSPCADGGPNYIGVNSGGCADRVMVNFNQESGFFSIGNVDYALDVVGFLVGTDPVSNFWTVENATNEAYLRGRIVLRENAGIVPEPATWAMLIAGFGMVGASLRRRTNATA